MRVKWYGDKVQVDAKQAANEGVRDGAEEVLNRANKIVPHDEGTLERSGTVKTGDLQAAVGYNTPYAVKLHEHPEYNFQGKGEGKWLEKTIKNKRNKDEIRDYIAKKIKGALG